MSSVTAFKFNPLTGKLDAVREYTLTQGDTLSGGTPECVVYVDASGNISTSTDFQFLAAKILMLRALEVQNDITIKSGFKLYLDG